MKITGFITTFLLFISSGVFAAQTTRCEDGSVCENKGFRILDPEYIKTLKINQMPTPRSYPLQVGTYWKCGIATGPFGEQWETCDILIVVCDEEGDECVELP